jgi:hypothetical protein
MSAALLIDIMLWASVAGVGYIAWRRGPKVMTASLREGTRDFIGIVPRIAVGVIGSGYIAAVIPQAIITGWLGPNSGWLGVATAVIAGRRDAGRAGGRLLHRRGGAEGRWRPAAGAGLCDRLGAVRLPAAAALGNPVHAGPVRLVSGRGFDPVPVPGCRHRHGHWQAVTI